MRQRPPGPKYDQPQVLHLDRLTSPVGTSLVLKAKDK